MDLFQQVRAVRYKTSHQVRDWNPVPKLCICIGLMTGFMVAVRDDVFSVSQSELVHSFQITLLESVLVLRKLLRIGGIKIAKVKKIKRLA